MLPRPSVRFDHELRTARLRPAGTILQPPKFATLTRAVTFGRRRALNRVSTPGLRKYVGVAEIPRVRNGLGIAILSTSKGLMSDREARQARTGGELLALIW